MPVQVGDIMVQKGGAVVSVGPDESIPNAARSLERHNIGILAVVDEEEALIGVLSERDLTRACGKDADKLAGLKVRDLMSVDVLTCRGEDTIRHAESLMRAHHIRHLPVLSDGALIGMLSIRDTANFRDEQLQIENTALRQLDRDFHQFLELCPVGIYVIVGEQIAYANQKARKIFAADVENDMLGIKSLNLFHPDHGETIKKRRMEAIQSPAARSFTEFRMRRLNGAEFFGEVAGTPICWDGESALLVLIRDITEQRQAANAVRESEERIRLIADAVPAQISYVDAGLRLRFVNKAYADRFGLPREDIVGKHIREIRGEDHFQTLLPHIEKVFSGERVNFESEWSLGTSGLRHYLSHLIPHIGESAEILGYFVLFTDITEQKQVVLATEEAREAAELANRSKSEFLANMSHEIRTPMNGVLGMAGLLLGTELTDEQSSYIRMLRDSGESLMTIINDILDYSKMEAGKVEIERAPFGLTDALDSVVRILGPQAVEKGLEFKTELAPDAHAFVTGDSGRLRQILINLAGNAIKFTESGRVVIRVSVDSPGAEAQILRFEVTDTGIGLTEAEQEKLFSRFTQADASTTRKFGGTGLGLSICRQLCELMDGSIGVYSVPGEGSTFWFTLSFEKAERAPRRQDDEDDPAHHPNGDMNATAGLRTLRILLAEDNVVNQQLARAVLVKAGHHVDVVGNGIEAINSLRAQPYDLVLMDVHMPEMDGVTAARAIRDLPGEIGHIPIVALTANAMKGDREKYLAAGMTDYLSKPFDPKSLFSAIAKYGGGNSNDTSDETLPAREVVQEVVQSREDAHALEDLIGGLDDLIADV